jgi:hypothetical protein
VCAAPIAALLIGAIIATVAGHATVLHFGSVALGVSTRSPDAQVFWLLGATIALGIIVAAIPTLLAVKAGQACQNIEAARSGSPRLQRFQNVLIGVQATLAASATLLTVIFAQHVAQVRRVDYGFQPEHLYTISSVSHLQPTDASQSLETVFQQARLSPGVDAVSRVAYLPTRSTLSEPAFPPASTWETIPTDVHVIRADPAFTAATGLRVTWLFGEAARLWEHDADVVLISATLRDSLVRKAVDHRLPRCVALGGPALTCLTIVGIMEDVRFLGFREGLVPTAIVRLRDVDAIGGVMLRIRGPSSTAMRTIRSLGALAAGASFLTERSVNADVNAQSAPWRYGLATLFYLCLLGMLTAVGGTIAVVMSAVNGRLRDYAIRRALGASASHIVRTVIGHVVLASSIGIALGLASTVYVVKEYFGFLDMTLLNFGNVAIACFAVAGSLALGLVLPTVVVLRVDPVKAIK